jgi:hypothetical protein
MQREMFTDAEAVSDFGWATYSTASSNSAANTCWLAAPNSGPATVKAK